MRITYRSIFVNLIAFFDKLFQIPCFRLLLVEYFYNWFIPIMTLDYIWLKCFYLLYSFNSLISWEVRCRHSPGLSLPIPRPAILVLLSLMIGCPTAEKILLIILFFPSWIVSLNHELASARNFNSCIESNELHPSFNFIPFFKRSWSWRDTFPFTLTR